MRSRLLLLLLLALVPISPRATQAQVQDSPDEVSFDYFYTALQSQGEWFGTDSFGYVFQPRVAATDPNWRPYSDGYWSFTDDGWTWLSYEDFGWATYHYGRWTKLAAVGWVWVPGYEWAPAWVSWRTSPAYGDELESEEPPPAEGDGDYIGWAPLPPNAVLYPGAGPGIAGGIDQIYDVPPELYCFVPVQLFCAPALIVVIVPPAINYVCIRRTINVTHCYWGARHGVPFIYAGGPNFARLQPHVPKPIPRFKIERLPGLPPGGTGSVAFLNQVRGHTLQVRAPRVVPPSGVPAGAVGMPRGAAAKVRPPRVKATIANAAPVAGWNTPGVQPQAMAAAREQFQREATRARRPVAAAEPVDPSASAPLRNAVPAPGNQRQPARRLVEPSSGNPPGDPTAGSSPTQMPAPQGADLARRQQILAEQQRRAEAESARSNPATSTPQTPLDQNEMAARQQALREQQSEQVRQAQRNAQAQRQQQLEVQRQAQIEQQRRAQAEAQARAQAQRDAMRQQQQQADQQRRAVEAQRRMEAARQGAQPSQNP